jgi:hypothetical protein
LAAPQELDVNTCPVELVKPAKPFADTGPFDSDSTGIETSKGADGASISPLKTVLGVSERKATAMPPIIKPLLVVKCIIERFAE